jgi:hypothetical protein
MFARDEDRSSGKPDFSGHPGQIDDRKVPKTFPGIATLADLPTACFPDPRIGLAGPPHRRRSRPRFSGIYDGDRLDLDHEIGSGETRDADCRAGRAATPR